jgi:nitronate monooxygenase
MLLHELRHPIVLAPLAGGPSTPALAAAVCEAGGLGFLAAGYLSADALRDDIHALREQTGAPFGVNLFVPGSPDVDEEAVGRYVERLRAEESPRYGVEPGEPRFDDDDWDAKLRVLAAEKPPVVSFTFGWPSREVISSLAEAGSEVWATVTDLAEARIAHAAGAGALVLQGAEAGGHRASFVDRPGAEQLGTLALTRLVARALDLPLIAAGGLGDAPAVAAVLAAGASAA